MQDYQQNYQEQIKQLERSPAPPQVGKRGWRGAIGGFLAALAVLAGKLKFLLVLLKLAYVKTLITLLISFGAYAFIFGPWFAAGLVVMILVHEMGHVVEIRRQGMKATAPIFIPFLGAAIFQRSHPTTAYKQALIGIAGPISGSVGAAVATAAYLGTGSAHWAAPLLLAAWIGFYINLFNLIPVGMLDGGWVLGAVSKWAYVAGLGALAGLVLFLHFLSPILILIVVFGLPMMVNRFRNAADPYYATVTGPQRWGLFGAWLGLVLALGWGSLWAETALAALK